MGTWPWDRHLSDEELRAEIELLADVMDAVTSSRCPLSDTQIDQALGIGLRAA
jgi:hypothetical protein